MGAGLQTDRSFTHLNLNVYNDRELVLVISLNPEQVEVLLNDAEDFLRWQYELRLQQWEGV